MTTRLDLYNKALLICGERFLSSLVENREPRHLLDHVWNTGGNNYCLEMAQWWFAMRAVQIDYDPAISPAFGLQKAFTKPTDWIKTSAVCSDEYFKVPITGYAFEANDWYCDITPIYVKYVSNDVAYGGDLSKWPETFSDYAAAYYASKIISKLGGDRADQRASLFGPPGAPDRGLLHQNLHKAKNAAAVTQPTQFPAEGSWTAARRGGRGRFDRGNRGSLIG